MFQTFLKLSARYTHFRQFDSNYLLFPPIPKESLRNYLTFRRKKKPSLVRFKQMFAKIREMH
jgi:hypothetical protein